MSVEDKEDLDMPNHLSGKVRKQIVQPNYFLTVCCGLYIPQFINPLPFNQLKRYLKLSFNAVTELQEASNRNF